MLILCWSKIKTALNSLGHLQIKPILVGKVFMSLGSETFTTETL